MLSGSWLEGGSGSISSVLRSNQRGDLSLRAAQAQETPSLPVEPPSPIGARAGRSGIRMSGESIGAKRPNSRLAPSRASKQHLYEGEGRGRASIALASSSERIASHPDWVRCRRAPRAPATWSLATSPSFLIRLSSAEACGIRNPESRASTLTVAPPSVSRSRSRRR